MRNQRETRSLTQSDPKQIPPLSSTFRCRLRNHRSSARSLPDESLLLNTKGRICEREIRAAAPQLGANPPARRAQPRLLPPPHRARQRSAWHPSSAACTRCTMLRGRLRDHQGSLWHCPGVLARCWCCTDAWPRELSGCGSDLLRDFRPASPECHLPPNAAAWAAKGAVKGHVTRCLRGTPVVPGPPWSDGGSAASTAIPRPG